MERNRGRGVKDDTIVLNRVVNRCLTVEVAFDQYLEECEGMNEPLGGS